MEAGAVKSFLRGIGMAVGGVVVLAIVVVGWASLKLGAHTRRVWPIPETDLRGVRGDAARGKYLVEVGVGCTECHGEDLAGGTVIEDPAIGYVYGSNITSAALKDMNDGAIARAIHDGVDRHGRAIVIMPAESYQYLSRQDVADMVAWLRRSPAVDRPSRPSRIGPVMRVLWATGKVPGVLPVELADHARPFVPRVAEGPTRAYGAYLYKSHCAGCHRDDGMGGHVVNGPPDWPPAANLTVDGAGGWTKAGFIKAFRTGVNPSGGTIQPPMGLAMKRFGKRLKERDLVALWEHLRTLKGVEL